MVRVWTISGILAAAILAGCAPDVWHYEWGSYDDSVKSLYAPTAIDSKSVGVQIQQLESEIQLSNSAHKANEPSRVPPGKYAHLGYLYTTAGDQVAARRCFENEKLLYPESTVFIDGILKRMQRAP